MSWRLLGDSVAHNIMTSGLRIEFLSPPPLSRFHPLERKSKRDIIRVMVKDLLERDIIVKVSPKAKLFFSHLFVVPKKEGKLRLIIDLKKLNRFIVKKPLKMQNIKSVTRSILHPSWACKIDLKDAYYHVPIAPMFQRYLSFHLDGVNYSFRKLPFGLTIAPWAFSRIIKPLKGYLHKLKINFHSYLDDFLIINESQETLTKQITLIQGYLGKLDLTINLSKSVLTPSRQIEYLGIQLDCLLMRVGITPSKIDQIQEKIALFQERELFSKRQLESVIGLLSFVAPCLKLGHLYLAPLQTHLKRMRSVERDAKLFDPREISEHLANWLDISVLERSVPMGTGDESLPSLVLMTDASIIGWGDLWASFRYKVCGLPLGGADI